jgi:hypothetical protein
MSERKLIPKLLEGGPIDANKICDMLLTNMAVNVVGQFDKHKTSRLVTLIAEKYTVRLTQNTIESVISMRQRFSASFNNDHDKYLDVVEEYHAWKNLLDVITGKDFGRDILIVDDYHAGTLDSDILCSIWRYAAINNFNTTPRLILLSSTPIKSKAVFANELPFYAIQERSVSFTKIAAQYADKNYACDDTSMISHLAQAIEVRCESNKTTIQEKGAVWVTICPRLAYMDELEKHIKHDKIQLIKVTAAGRKNIDAGSYGKTAGVCKMILTTNLPTIPDSVEISAVFDTMQENVMYSFGEMEVLERVNISKSTADHRASRAVRDTTSFVYRMCTKEFYDELCIERDREIERLPLTKPICRLISLLVPMMKDCRSWVNSCFECAMIDPGLRSKFDHSFDLLKRFNIYNEEKNTIDLEHDNYFFTCKMSIPSWIFYKNNEKSICAFLITILTDIFVESISDRKQLRESMDNLYNFLCGGQTSIVLTKSLTKYKEIFNIFKYNNVFKNKTYDDEEFESTINAYVQFYRNNLPENVVKVIRDKDNIAARRYASSTGDIYKLDKNFSAPSAIVFLKKHADNYYIAQFALEIEDDSKEVANDSDEE